MSVEKQYFNYWFFPQWFLVTCTLFLREDGICQLIKSVGVNVLYFVWLDLPPACCGVFNRQPEKQNLLLCSLKGSPEVYDQSVCGLFGLNVSVHLESIYLGHGGSKEAQTVLSPAISTKELPILSHEAELSRPTKKTNFSCLYSQTLLKAHDHRLE